MTGMFLKPHVAGRQCLRILLFCLAVCASMRAAPDDHQLDTITVEAKRKLEHGFDQFVQAAIVHRVGEPLMRSETRVPARRGVIQGTRRIRAATLIRGCEECRRAFGAPKNAPPIFLSWSRQKQIRS